MSDVIDEPGSSLVRRVDRLQPGKREHGEYDDARDEAERDRAHGESGDYGTHVTRVAHNPAAHES